MTNRRSAFQRFFCLFIVLVSIIGIFNEAKAEWFSEDWMPTNYYYSHKFDNDTGTLSIRGTVSINDFRSSETPPWDYLGGHIKKVSILHGITEIGDRAFEGYKNLREVYIPSSVTRIGESAFSLTDLRSIDIPEGVVEIDGFAFSMCDKLESVSLPDTLETIGASAFWSTGLTRVEIPDSVCNMHPSAFDKSVTLVVSEGSYGEQFAIENGFEYTYPPEYDFKQFRWGDSREDIIAIEGTPVYEEEVGGLTYHTTAAGLDVNLFYAVGDEGLYSVVYDFTEEHSSDILYISDYMKVLDEITQKYGEPSISGKNWESDLYEEIYSGDEALALVSGHLSYMALFELERTNIFMYMFADNYEVTTNVIYLSKVNSSGSSEGQGYSNDF